MVQFKMESMSVPLLRCEVSVFRRKTETSNALADSVFLESKALALGVFLKSKALGVFCH
jgi:hypothetical protein